MLQLPAEGSLDARRLRDTQVDDTEGAAGDATRGGTCVVRVLDPEAGPGSGACPNLKLSLRHAHAP